MYRNRRVMKHPLIVLLITIAPTLTWSHPHEVVGVPTTRLERQSRTVPKHRIPPRSYHAINASIAGIIALNQHTPAHLDDPRVKASNELISPIEKRVYRVAGDLWRVKMEENDCDYHLDLSGRGQSKSADRIIVEIPQGRSFNTARRQLLSTLPGDYAFRPGTTKNLTQSIPMRVTGYAFYDAHHFNARKVRGNGHGTRYTATVWELHPVWKVEPIGNR
jgi:hypothetical protein